MTTLSKSHVLTIQPSNELNNAIDRMNDLTGTPKRRSPCWSVVAVALAGISGCAQFGGANQQAPFVATTGTTATQQVGQPQAGQLPTGQLQAGQPPTNGLQPTAAIGPPSWQAASPAISQVGHTSSVAEQNRHVARQFPNNPGTGGFVPQSAVTVPGTLGDPYAPVIPYSSYQGPRERTADLVLSGFPARTGRITVGGAVNSDAGLTGQLTVDERNFDITRWPTSFQDLFGGTAFRGRGQTLRLQAAPGTVFQRYTATFVEPSVFNRPISMSVSGFLFDRRFNDWDEARLGGRVGLGYRITPDLSLSVAIGGQNVDIRRPSVAVPPAQLNDVLGDNTLYSGEVSLRHDTRDRPILASRGHYFELTFEEAFGDFNYSRFDAEFRQFWTLAERADSSGRQTLSFSTRLGFSGEETPIFENYFAGGYATMRGFNFRGASPVDPATGVELGGRFQWLNSIEYMFPITADDAFRGVAFVDFGTVEQDISIDADNFRIAPGLGLRVAIPALGPAPLAFDFAFPVSQADNDDQRIFSFYTSAVR